MRIGVYNRHLPTLGGGEQYSLALAEALGAQHEVDFIAHVPITVARIRAQLGLDLARVRLRVVPERPAHLLGPLSAEYDLFVNASNGDFVPPQAAHNALLVYFPMPTGLGVTLRGRVGGWVRGWGALPNWQVGAFGVQTVDGQSVRGLTPLSMAFLPSVHRPYVVRFKLANALRAPCTVALEVDGVRHNEWRLPARRGDSLRMTDCGVIVAAAGRARRMVLRVTQPGKLDPEAVALYVTRLEPSHRRAGLYRRIFEERFAALGVRLQQPLPANLREIAAQYDLIWAISRYSQSWIQRYWGQPSQLLYPPVAVERFAPKANDLNAKRNQIVSVGRFFAGNHNKKHDVLIQAFRRLVDEGLAGWELHLAGGTLPDAIHANYLAELRRMAEGYPITLHPDLAGERLIRLYGESALYWHAAGYGESETRDPIKFEHFGITTVEAMAAGCVPIVLGQGGQRELIEPGQDGYLWYTSDELLRHTRALIEQPERRVQMAAAAQQSSRRFDRSHFHARLAETLTGIGVDIAYVRLENRTYEKTRVVGQR